MIRLDFDDSPNTISDWVELYLTTLNKSISKDDLRQILEDYLDDEVTINEFVDSVWGELQQRNGLYLNVKPYEIKDHYIEPKIKWKDAPEYFLCLYFSCYGASGESKGTSLFELVSGFALKSYLQGDFHIFGFPTNSSKIKSKTIALAKLLNEKFSIEPARRYKERGLDVVAWKDFNDKRSNKVVILAQCSAGSNWESKKGDLNLDAWCEHIHWAVRPIRGFTVPRILNLENWHDYSKDFGLILDRCRIYNLLQTIKLNNTEKKKIFDWCKKKVKNIKEI